MSCSPFRDQLADFLCGALAPDAAAALEEHLLGCAACGAELAALLALSEDLAAPPAPAAVSPPSGRERGKAARWLLAALAAAALALGAAQVLLQEPSPPAAPQSTQQPPPQPSGDAWSDYRVGPGVQPPLVVHTPRGRVRVAPGALRETAFRVLIEREGDMGSKGGILIGGGAAVVLVAVSAGAILFEPGGGQAALRVEAGQEVRAGAGAPEVRALAAGAAVAPGSASAAAAELGALREELARLQSEGQANQQERQRLEQELIAARGELEQLRAGGADPAPARPRGPRLRWGRWTDEPALAQLDWQEGAAAARRMRDGLQELLQATRRGESLSQEKLLAITKDNQKLIDFELEGHGKLPSHAPGNGAFTHPSVQVNLMAEQLAQAGLPLSEPQELQLLRVCQDYDSAWEQQEAGWAPDALALEKLLAELQLKQGLSLAIDGILSPTQREALTSPEARGLFSVDLYSPALMLAGTAAPFPVDSPAAAAAQLGQFATRWGLTNEPIGAPLLEPELLERWAQAALEGQLPLPRAQSTLFDVPQALRAGAAQLAVMRELLQRPDLPAATRQALLADQGLAIPRLSAP